MISSRKIEDLIPELQELYKQFKATMTTEEQDFIVTSTYRDQECQDKLFAQGRTQTGVVVTWAKHSKHTDREAFDIAMLKNGKITWVTKDYLKAVEIGLSVGLDAGGAWLTKKDYPHFQYVRKVIGA
jgi:peptidoglycan L-alanyl-D-glutamate endopeptidase CwlK